MGEMNCVGCGEVNDVVDMAITKVERGRLILLEPQPAVPRGLNQAKIPSLSNANRSWGLLYTTS